MTHFDVIVVGAGGVGSSTIYHLARRGVRAIALDRFSPGHDRGSSHGQSRMIRLAYHEHPNYVPLLFRAYDLWRELEQETQQELFHENGILVGGPAECDMISGVRRAVVEHNLPIQELTVRDVRELYPAYRLPEGFSALFEQRAGFLMVEHCVKAHANAAVQRGAIIKSDTTVRDWALDGSRVIVTTDNEVFSADRLVITAGPWADQLLTSLKIPLEVLRKPLFWYRAIDPSYHFETGCPCFLLETLGGIFYGFPAFQGSGVKLAEHTGGDVVSDPLQVDRSLNPTDKHRVENCLSSHLPGVSTECTGHAVCMYTMSPDGHFIVGSHPEFSEVVFAAGLSGHGFKFTTVLGEILADLALDGVTKHPIEFLSPQRFVA